MRKKYEIEFSKIYKRLMALEIVVKERIVDSCLTIFGNDVLDEFNNFFNNKHILKCYNDGESNRIKRILFSEQTKNDKFINLINILYLNHLLRLILTYNQFKKEEITQILYYKKPEKFQKLIDSKNLIKDLRNDIAHYNFKRYEENKQEYLKALILFEIHLGCNLAALSELPELDKKLPIKDILLKIKELREDLFISNPEEQEYNYNKDRILLDLFDDFAVLYGWDYSELPSPWSILRTKYDLVKLI
jgi:hypothetical protein